MLCAFGVLLRPNALTAAPILGAYIAWPMKVYWKRTAITFVPAMVLFFLLVQFVYYGVLGVTRQHPLQSIMVFDLGGISHFTGQNQFPVTWTSSESKLLLEGCYRPTEWDIYWRLEPCEFVMRKLEKDEKIFGTRAVVDAWIRAVFRHPIAYLEHRAGFMWNFLTGANLTMWVADVERPDREVFTDRPAFAALKRIHDVLKPTPLFRAGTWFVACIAICGFGLAASRDRGGRFCHRFVRDSRDVCRDFLCRRGRVGLSLRVSGGARHNCGRSCLAGSYASTGANWASVSSVKRPPSLLSSSNVPISTMRP